MPQVQIGVDKGAYTFDASLQTITFTGITIDTIEQIKPIVNGERGEVIFNPATDGLFGTLTAGVLLLEFDTAAAGHADTDELYICVKLPDEPSKVDDDNSSTTPLGAAATFTGTWTDVERYHGITVLVDGTAASTADGTLFLEFSHDGLSTNRSIVITVDDITTAPPRTLGKVSKFFRVRYTNGSTALTTFDLQTTINTEQIGLVSRLDQALSTNEDVTNVRAVLTGVTNLGDFVNAGVTNAGNLKASLFDPQSGFPSIVDPNGSLKTGEVMVLAGGVLDGRALSSLLWTELSINGGSRAGGQGEQVLSTGTSPDGQFILQSAKMARFIITQFNINHIGVQTLPAALLDTDTIFEWGSVDFIDSLGALNASANGIFIRVTGGSPPTWEIVSIKDGVETVTDSSLFNGAQASLLNKTPDLSVYETRYNAGTALFYQGSNFLHRVAGLVDTYASTYDFPVAIRIRNINGNTTNRSVSTRALGTYRLGEERGELIPRAFTATQLIKTGSGYVGKASLSRAGSGGGAGTAEIYDGIDATGILIGRIDVGGDDVKGITLDGTFTIGLYILISGSGTNTLTINFE